MNKYIHIVCILVCLTFFAVVSTISAAPSGFQVHLTTRSIHPPENTSEWLSSHNSDESHATIIQFYNHPSSADHISLAARGIHLQTYLGGGAWSTYLTEGYNADALTSSTIRWIGDLLADDKQSVRVIDREVPVWAEYTSSREIVAVRFMRPLSVADAEKLLLDYGFEPGAYIELLHTFYVAGPYESIATLASLPEVLWICYPGPPLSVMNAQARAITGTDIINAPPYGLTGQGVTICVYDSGMIDVDHPDFEDRASFGTGEIIALSNHSTHVAGTIGGNGAPDYRGMAPACELVSFKYEECDPYCLYNSPQDIYQDYLLSVVNFGAEIANNSIGSNIPFNGYPCDWQGDYELTSSLLDTIVQGGLGVNYIVTFAAGNDRGDGGLCGSTYETMGVPAGAKNIITVGATDDDDDMTDFSGWGPVDDGRIKPEVCAPGEDITSCFIGNEYGTLSGTSMSTPVVSGNIVLMLEAYHSYVADATPLPSTIKAILCNSAVDLGNFGPDYRYGFGRISAVENIESIIQYRFYEANLADDATWTLPVTVTDHDSILKITLAWSDVPAAPGNHDHALINDLDLTLQSPSGDLFYPFILDPNAPGQPAEVGVNDIDVVEQVLVELPETGEWTIIVTGTDIPLGPQSFSLASSLPLQSGIIQVSGVVTNADNGEPVDNARISVVNGPQQIFSNENGEYTIYVFADNDMTILCEAYGFQSIRTYIQPGDEDELVRDFALPLRNANDIHGHVINEAGQSLADATVTITEVPSITMETDNEGEFEISLPIDRVYEFHAEFDDLSGSERVYVEEGTPMDLSITVYDPEDHLAGPDGYGYIAIESTDDHPLAPEYDWIAIDPMESGPGTRLSFTQEEDPRVLDLPFAFKYYGQNFTEVTVNENGFFCFGDLSDMDPGIAADFSNSGIPGSDGPPAMVAPFWEDFHHSFVNFSYYSDAAENRFILEWFNSRQYSPEDAFETFQVILYSPVDYPTSTGDGMILFQYHTVVDLYNATVGIESPNEDMGIEICYFNMDSEGEFNPAVSEITDETAILFYRTGGSVYGSVTMVPESDYESVLITDNRSTVECDGFGDYLITGVYPGLQELFFSAPGFEPFILPVFVEENQITTNANATMWQLLPPTDLNGNPLGNNQYRIRWNAPDFSDLDLQPGHSDDHGLDELTGRFRVYRDGIYIGETADTFYTDQIQPNMFELYWVTAMYTRAESDTSNHHWIIMDVAEENGLLPTEFSVSAAYPNPFNPTTQFTVALPQSANMEIAVYDILGRQVEILTSGILQTAGYHSFTWNADQLASGMYFITVNAGPDHAVRKVLLLK